jgi:hypothetical protein
MMNTAPSPVPDKEDKAILKNKSPSYVMGWNKVKHRQEEGAAPVRKQSRKRKGS